MYGEHFSEKCIKCDKYKNIIKMRSIKNDEYEQSKHNLKIYNSYWNQCTNTTTKEF